MRAFPDFAKLAGPANCNLIEVIDVSRGQPNCRKHTAQWVTSIHERARSYPEVFPHGVRTVKRSTISEHDGRRIIRIVAFKRTV